MHPHIQINCLIWSWIQLSILLISTSYLFANIATIVSPGIFVYGLFIFFSVYSFTELMDRHRFALLWEIMKNVLGFFVIYKTGGWFSASPWFLSLIFPLYCGYYYQHLLLPGLFLLNLNMRRKFRITINISTIQRSIFIKSIGISVLKHDYFNTFSSVTLINFV